ncbi:hypothetical protein JCM10207_005588, partial [Rhodosporidiobolus poonsookiae]
PRPLTRAQDIIWRTPSGELGRLQSSTLGRRVPALPLPAALPPPALAAQAPQTTLLGGPSPALPPLPPPTPNPSAAAVPAPLQEGTVPQPSADGLQFDLTVADLPRPARVRVDEPFALDFSLRVRQTDFAPAAGANQKRGRRTVRLAAQWLDPHAHASAPELVPAAANASAQQAQTQGYGVPGALPTPTTGRASLDSAPAPAAELASALAPAAPRPRLHGVALPLPLPSLPAQAPTGSAAPPPQYQSHPSRDVVRLGPGVVDLGLHTLAPPSSTGGEGEEGGEPLEARWRGRWVALSSGLQRVGGVRVLLLSSSEEVEGEGVEAGKEEEGEREARTVLEVGVVGEVWVQG